MRKLLGELSKLKNGEVRKIIDSRINEFKAVGKKPSSEIFKELCFCILTANSTAERCIEVHCNVGDGFLKLNEQSLQKKLKTAGCRFHTKRAGYIAEARRYKSSIKQILSKMREESEKREWLAENIKGIGYKEASHFLRNIGYADSAIIDFHIVDILADNGLIKRPKSMTKQKYVEIEEVLRGIAKKAKLSLAELDLYLWYMETGKVLK